MRMLEDARGRNGDRAVSPVIGVILMVAITVILTAVVASFVLSFADGGGSNAPQVSFASEYDETDNVVTVTVQSGDAFDAAQVTFEGDVAAQGTGIPNNGPDWADSPNYGAGSTVTAGDSVEVGVAGPGYTVEIVWQADGGGESSIIRTLEGPES